MSDSIYHYQSVSLSPSSKSVPSSSKCTLLTFPLPFHSISSCLIQCIGYIPLLKILHNQLCMFHACALKSVAVGSFDKYTTFTVPSGEMCCHAVTINIDQIIHLYSLVCKLIWTHEENWLFSAHLVLVVLIISNRCVLALWSDQSAFMALYGF